MDKGRKRKASEREEETKKEQESSKADQKKQRVDEVGKPDWLSNLPDLALDHLLLYLSNNYTHPVIHHTTLLRRERLIQRQSDVNINSIRSRFDSYREFFHRWKEYRRWSQPSVDPGMENREEEDVAAFKPPMPDYKLLSW